MSGKRHIQGLMDEPPISVYPSLAKAFGNVNKAIVMQQIHFLLNVAKLSDNQYVYVNDRWWVYNTYEQWQENHFSWLSISAIKNIFTALEGEGLILTMQGVKDPWDRRKWYTIDYDAFVEFVSCMGQKVADVHQTKSVPSEIQKVADDYKESETTTETTVESAQKSKKASPTEKRFKYPVKRGDWTWRHIEQYATENPAINTLAGFNAPDMSPTLKQLPTKHVAHDAIDLFDELERLNVATERYASLYKFTLKRQVKGTYGIFKRMSWALADWIKQVQTEAVIPVSTYGGYSSMEMNAAAFMEGRENA